MKEEVFEGKVEREGKLVLVRLPFDPNEAWGAKAKHFITGTAGGCKVRGPLAEVDGIYALSLGAAWLRDNVLPDTFEVRLRPEGPQTDLLGADIQAALDGDPEAKEFFLALATFYRKGYIKWIEGAKKPETRAARITEMMSLLRNKQKQR